MNEQILLRDLSVPLKQRRQRYKDTGPYYFTPGPLITRAADVPQTTGGYLNQDGTVIDEGSFVRLRVQAAHDVEDANIRHSGWFTDDDGSGETMYGIVARLPKGRGFLRGYTMGPQMISGLDRSYIYGPEELRDAAHAADHMAKRAAEDERDYQNEERAADEAAQQEREINEGGF